MHGKLSMNSGVLLLVAGIAAGAIGAQSPDDSSPRPQAAVEIEIKQFKFNADTVRVVAGDSVRWTNRDVVPHTSTADEGEWESPLIEPGKSFTQTFNQAGTFAYHCTPHPFMRGVVIVEAERHR
jgi:amicyanin